MAQQWPRDLVWSVAIPYHHRAGEYLNWYFKFFKSSVPSVKQTPALATPQALLPGMHGFAGLTPSQPNYPRRNGYSPQSLSLLGIESHLHLHPITNQGGSTVHGVVGAGRTPGHVQPGGPIYYHAPPPPNYGYGPPCDRTRFYYS